MALLESDRGELGAALCTGGSELSSPDDWFGDLALESLIELGEEADQPATRGTAQEAEEGSCDSNERRKAKRREIAKNYRIRKRQGVLKLRKRSRELQEEQVYLRSRVVELQGEMEALRRSDITDLSMENELLRVEIKRHKAFISQVLTDALHKAPSDTSPEEQYRLVRNGLESGKAQLLALAYSATRDPTWRPSPSIVEHPLGKHARHSFQTLPHGVPREEITRIKIRYAEIFLQPVVGRLTHDKIKRMDLPERPSPFFENTTIYTEDITPPNFAHISKQIGADESTAILRSCEVTHPLGDEERLVREEVSAEVFGYTDIVLSQVFPEYCERYGISPTTTVRGLVTCRSNFSNAESDEVRGCLAGNSDAPSTDKHHWHGIIMCTNPVDASETFVLSLNSLPMDEPLRPDLPHIPKYEMFDQEGHLHPRVFADLEVQNEDFIALFEQDE